MMSHVLVVAISPSPSPGAAGPSELLGDNRTAATWAHSTQHSSQATALTRYHGAVHTGRLPAFQLRGS